MGVRNFAALAFIASRFDSFNIAMRGTLLNRARMQMDSRFPHGTPHFP
jgi:hypothetical protein